MCPSSYKSNFPQGVGVMTIHSHRSSLDQRRKWGEWLGYPEACLVFQAWECWHLDIAWLCSEYTWADIVLQQNCVNNMRTSVGCVPVTDQCLCGNAAFEDGIRDCANQSCSAEDATAAVDYAGSFCLKATGTTAPAAATTPEPTNTTPPPPESTAETETTTTPTTATEPTSASAESVTSETETSTSSTATTEASSTVSRYCSRGRCDSHAAGHTVDCWLIYLLSGFYNRL